MPNKFGDKTRGRTVVQRIGVVPLVQRTFVHDTNHVADGKGFELKVPNLDELINQFEAPDETIGKANESFKQHLADLKQRGFVKETREEIKQRR